MITKNDELLDLIREYRVVLSEIYNKINSYDGDCKSYLAQELKKLEELEIKSLNVLLKHKND